MRLSGGDQRHVFKNIVSERIRWCIVAHAEPSSFQYSKEVNSSEPAQEAIHG